MVCVCGHSKHAFDEPTVCIEIIDCKCPQYRESTPENQVQTDYTKYLESIRGIKGRIRWLLQNIRFLRNYKNKDFVDFYHLKVDKKADPESIRRAKQELAAKNPQLYGPLDPKTIEQKALKQTAMMEFAIHG